MTNEWQFADPFLRRLDPYARDEIRKRREAWGLAAGDFYPRVERWFGNFKQKDRPLALKLLLKLQYFSEPTFRRRIQDLWLQIAQYLHASGTSVRDLRLVVPDTRGDSADRHAYDIIKAWGLEQKQVVTVNDLREAEPRCVLVFFNDTHGTGNQFLREVFREIDRDRFTAVFVVAVTIAARALRRFRGELADIRVLPEEATPSVHDEFTAAEVYRLRELGMQVYSKHPLGYGDAGLLIAYYFQCPNNTLPLIWADSAIGNNTVDGQTYPWASLFPYQPKAKSETPSIPAEPVQPPDTSLVDGPWKWSDDDRQRIVSRIKEWGLASSAFYRNAGAWFGNFEPHDRDVARDVFLAACYLDIAKVRAGIRRLRAELMADLGRAGGDMSDAILVTTGDEKNSVYHYAYEFIRQWSLSVDQVWSLSRLSPDRVIDKTLVFFHHTRATGEHFVATHAGRLATLTPRAVVFAAYAMAPKARDRFTHLQGKPANRVLYLPEVSSAVHDLVPQHCDAIARIERDLRPGDGPLDPERSFLAAYYFQCPDASSPLLWADRMAADGGRRWTPLFHHIAIPRMSTG